MTTDEKIDRILELVEGMAKGRPATPANPALGAPPSTVADDAELDGKYGNPEVRRDPPRWKGQSYKGKKFSQCPIDYLETLVGFLEWQAQKDAEKGTDEGTKYANYARRDAARARGWILRKESGWKPAPTSNEALFGGSKGESELGLFPEEDDIPF